MSIVEIDSDPKPPLHARLGGTNVSRIPMWIISLQVFTSHEARGILKAARVHYWTTRFKGPGSSRAFRCSLMLSEQYFKAFWYKMGLRNKKVDQFFFGGVGGGVGTYCASLGICHCKEKYPIFYSWHHYVQQALTAPEPKCKIDWAISAQLEH